MLLGPTGQSIVDSLQAVRSLRARHANEAALGQRVHRLKAWQHARFAQTYADLLTSARYGPAARFFLEDLYGPYDFSERDSQFARIVPALVRLFPGDIVQTVAELAALHALSEELDTRMAEGLCWPRDSELDWAAYGALWRETGRPTDRELQIALMLRVGESLDGYTRNPLLRHSLRLMRGPAAAAGLGSLQRFLETGFDTFKTMKGGRNLLDTIANRERQIAEQLFRGG